MSQANDLLESLVEEATSGTPEEGNIVIGRDRFIVVPESLKKIGVQYDHNVETVTFDCPRYWDEWDMSKLKAYVNYMRADGVVGTYLCDSIYVDDADDTLIHFDWCISGNVTGVQGNLAFLVCLKKVDTDGNETVHWNSELNTEMYISEGMKCQDIIIHRYPDIITQLLLRMGQTELDNANWRAATETELNDHVAEIEVTAKGYMESAGKSAESAASDASTASAAAETASAAASKSEEIYQEVYGTVNSSIATESKVGLMMGGENTVDDDGALVLTRTTQASLVTDAYEGGLKVNKIFGRSEQGEDPSPDNPQEIVSPDDAGSIGVRVYRGNLLESSYRNSSGVIFAARGTATEADGVYSLTSTEADSYVYSSRSAGGSYNAETCSSLILIPYHVTEVTMALSNEVFNDNYIIFYDKDKVRLNHVGSNLKSSVTAPVPEGARYFTVRFGYNDESQIGVTNSTTVMVNLGAEALPWEPFKAQKAFIAVTNGLPAIPVDSDGLWTDLDGQQWVGDYLDVERGVHVHNVGMFDFTNLVGVRTTEYGEDMPRFDFPYGYNNANDIPPCSSTHRYAGFCTTLTYCKNPLGDNAVDNAICVYVNGGVYARCDQFETVDDFLAHMQSVDAKVYYILAEPYETKLTVDELKAILALRTNEPNTTVLCEADVEYEYGTSPVGAHSLEAMLQARENEIVAENSTYITYGTDRTAIPANADLNDYLTIGCYKCQTNTTVATLLNAPPFAGVAFTMDVVSGTGAHSAINNPNEYQYIIQRAMAMDGTIAFRKISTSGRGSIEYGEWYSVLSDYSMIGSSYADLMANTVSGYIPDALVVKEGFNDLNTSLVQRTGGTYTCSGNTIEEAIGIICDANYALYSGGVMCQIVTSDGEYTIRMRVASTGSATGIAQKWSDGTTYRFRREAGADAVLKKLGSGLKLTNLYFKSHRAGNSQYGTTIGAYGVTGTHYLTIDVSDYDTLTFTNIVLTNLANGYEGSVAIQVNGTTIATRATNQTAGSATVASKVVDVSGVDTAKIVFLTPAFGNFADNAGSEISVASIVAE